MIPWGNRSYKFDFSTGRNVTASRETVYRVLSDMERYPEFIEELISVRREGGRYRFVGRATLATASASLKVVETPGRMIAFELVEGPIERLSGRWQIDEGDGPGRLRVTLALRAESGRRGWWLLRMAALFIERKADSWVAAFVRRVEEFDNNFEL